MQELHVCHVANKNEDEEERKEQIPIEMEDDARIKNQHDNVRKEDTNNADVWRIEMQIDEESNENERERNNAFWPDERIDGFFP